MNWTDEFFLGGHPALDFVNTAGGRTKERDVERLGTFGDAVAWAHAVGVIDNAEREFLWTRSEHAPAEAGEALCELRDQREALHAFLLAGVEGTDCAPWVRDRVQADITTACAEATLSDRFRTGQAWVITTDDAGLRVLARRLALAGGSLLASDQRSQISGCGRCSWLFLDGSPSRRRRWCSMAICGNRAKVQRHQRR